MSAGLVVSYAILWVLVCVLAVLVLLLYRHFGLMALGTADGIDRDGLAVGERGVTLSGVTGDGAEFLFEPSSTASTLLLFAAADCEPCLNIFPTVQTLRRLAPGMRVVAVEKGDSEEALRIHAKVGPGIAVFADDGNGAFEKNRVRVTPFAIMFDADGRVVAKGLTSDTDRLRRLLSAGGEDAIADALAEHGPGEESTESRDVVPPLAEVP